MARFSSTPAAVPPPSTTATAARAATPADQPKPATATVPKPSTPAPRPAAATAPKPAAPKPAAPKSSLPAEYQTIASRNIFDSSAPAARASDDGYAALADERIAYYKRIEELQPYLEAVRGIAEVRRADRESAGMRIAGTAVAGAPAGAYGSVAPLSTTQAMRPDPKGRGVPLAAVYPTQPTMSARPSLADLDVPLAAAEKAKAIDEEYKKARRAYDEGNSFIVQKQEDPTFPRSQFPELAKQQRERLQRVADLAAARREYGLKD